MKIISIDDSELISNHLKELIHKIKGFTFSGHAKTIKQAIDLIEKTNPQIVFLDIVLKEESGLDLLAEIKENYPQIIVIMLTNNSDLFYRNKAKQLGADYFIDKSYQFDLIPNLLQNIAEN